jgi:hypothetical protein
MPVIETEAVTVVDALTANVVGVYSGAPLLIAARGITSAVVEAFVVPLYSVARVTAVPATDATVY